MSIFKQKCVMLKQLRYFRGTNFKSCALLSPIITICYVYKNAAQRILRFFVPPFKICKDLAIRGSLIFLWFQSIQLKYY